ncbi:MAG: WYL domain-containing protein [Bacteroidales bacterium]|nr:WYL domain-containing protein [Bacteroidales bacterium]
MPITKDAYMRYRILDKCFRSKLRYQIEDLVKACNDELNGLEKSVSRRTIYYDIEYMKSNDGWEAPIEVEKDGNRRYYHYSDPDFSIDKMPLSETQLKQIQGAVELLNSVEGLPQFEGLSDSLAKMGMMLYDTDTERCFSIEQNSLLVGREFITDLFNAIQYKTAVKITYAPYEAEDMEFVFHPQFLKQYNSRWYVFGVRQDNQEEIWNLAVDRIKKIEPSKIPYIKLYVEWKYYFDEIIGVTNIKDAPVEEVHFQVHGRTSYYLETKPLHELAIIHRYGDMLDVKLKVKINYELKRLLLSYAPDITILAPQHLIDEHKEMLEKALKQY